mgnify:CR=1 FL=1
MSARSLDGPRLAPATGGRARQLVVLLHGYGASGDDLIGLGSQWARRLPDAAFVAPHAPERLEQSAFGGFQWFGLVSLSPAEMAAGVERAAPALDAFLDSELARHGLTGGRLALVGFSQGTMMALQVGLRRQPGPAAIIGYSGVIAAPERLASECRARPPVLLVHGEDDPVIPATALHMTRVSLAAAAIPVEWHIRPGLGHGIDADGLALGERFLRQTLGDTR